MNKKFLSVAMFGALLAVSSGTFTSCKDYDDDINGLSERVDAVEKALDELKTQFGTLAYVKSVKIVGNQLIVEDQNGAETPYNLPDKNTTYTLSSTADDDQVTITLTPNDGSESLTTTFTITDDNTQLDPTLFWMNTDGKIMYGPKDNLEECIETGVTIPAKTEVVVTEIEGKNGEIVGFSIQVDGGDPVQLNILDILPITGFSWIPETYYNGIEAVEFETIEYSYYDADADDNKVSGDTIYNSKGRTMSTLPGVAKFYVNPSSASEKQLAEVTALYKDATNHTTRSAEINPEVVSKTLDKGILTASISADMNEAEIDPEKLDMIALQITTANGNKFTTPYFAAYNKKGEATFTLVDECAIVGGQLDTKDIFAWGWANTKAQVASINSNNVVNPSTDHLVQVIEYKDAKAGINLNDYVKLAKTVDGKSEIIDLAENKLSIEYVLCSYVVNGTDQNKYAKLNGNTLTGYNFEGQELSMIGKTPIVKAVVKDNNNDDKVVAVAYVKFLYVADNIDICGDWTAPVAETTEKDWAGCLAEGTAYDFTTTVEYMSTKVYVNVGKELGLPALSKEEFSNIYTFVTKEDGSNNTGDFKNKLEFVTSIKMVEGNVGPNEDNAIIEFNINEATLSQMNGDQEITFYGQFVKNTAAEEVSSKYYQYPVNVAIPYVVKIQNYPTTETIRDVNTFKIDQAWEGDFAVSKGNQLYLDMNEAVNLDNFVTGNGEELIYNNYKLAINDNDSKKIAKLDGDFVILTEQLVNAAEAVVKVDVYAVLCNGDEIYSNTVNVKFYNPAAMTILEPVLVIPDLTEGSSTEDLRQNVKIVSTKGEVLYEKGKATTLGKSFFGEDNTINLEIDVDATDPIEWKDKFAYDSNTGEVSFDLDGQNTVASGKKAICKVNVSIEFGADTNRGIKGAKLTDVITVEAWNQADYEAEYGKYDNE